MLIKLLEKPQNEKLGYKFLRYLGIIFVAFAIPAVLLYFINDNPGVFLILYWIFLFLTYNLLLYKRYLDKLIHMIIFRKNLKQVKGIVESYSDDEEDEESFMYETDTDIWLERLGIKNTNQN